MMTQKELWGEEDCELCGEPFKLSDTDVAEMVDDEGEHYIVHFGCGTEKRMELA